MTTNCPDSIEKVPSDGFGYAYKRKYHSWFLDYCRGFHSNYKCKVLHDDVISITNLKVGQRVGLCVTQFGELHYYVDGIAKATLCTGLPTDVSYWGIVDVYRKTTKVQLMSPKGGALTKQPVPLKQVSTKDHLAQTEEDQHRQVKVQADRLELLQLKLQELETKNREQELEKQKLQEKIKDIQQEHETKLNTANQQLQIANQDLKVENQELQGTVQELQAHSKSGIARKCCLSINREHEA